MALLTCVLKSFSSLSLLKANVTVERMMAEPAKITTAEDRKSLTALELPPLLFAVLTTGICLGIPPIVDTALLIF
jgi:hypothetical protein